MDGKNEELWCVGMAVREISSGKQQLAMTMVMGRTSEEAILMMVLALLEKNLVPISEGRAINVMNGMTELLKQEAAAVKDCTCLGCKARQAAVS